MSDFDLVSGLLPLADKVVRDLLCAVAGAQRVSESADTFEHDMRLKLLTLAEAEPSSQCIEHISCGVGVRQEGHAEL